MPGVFMLYLIIPPIIVVAALALLVYFFSKRSFEIEKVLEEAASLRETEKRPGRSSDSLRRLFLGILERFARGSKGAALGTYRFMHRWSMALKEKGGPKGGEVLSKTETDGTGPLPFRRVRKPSLPAEARPVTKEEAVLPGNDAPDLPPRRRRAQASRAERLEARPMVAPKVTRPDVGSEPDDTGTEKLQLEGILIERIASNPRDIEAYERLGDYYLEQENLQDAKECFKQVLRLSPVHRLAKIKIRRLEKMLERKGNF
jgi:tetratricopeptide (TPR) repeat protein